MGISLSGRACRLNIINKVDERIHRKIAQAEVALLDSLHTRLEFGLRPSVTSLTGAIDIEHRTTHMMVANLERAFPLS